MDKTVKKQDKTAIRQEESKREAWVESLLSLLVMQKQTASLISNLITSVVLIMWGLIDVYSAVCLSVPDVEKLSPRGGSSAMTEISDVSAERKNSNK